MLIKYTNDFDEETILDNDDMFFHDTLEEFSKGGNVYISTLYNQEPNSTKENIGFWIITLALVGFLFSMVFLTFKHSAKPETKPNYKILEDPIEQQIIDNYNK